MPPTIFRREFKIPDLMDTVYININTMGQFQMTFYS